jgi:DNA-binding IscR family transcriptional regulator
MLTQCSQGDHDCQVRCQHPFERHWQSIHQAIEGLLSPITLADLITEKPLPLLSQQVTNLSQMENAHGR